MTRPEHARVVELRPRRSAARAAFVALRPRQWSKNLLLLAGIVFAAKLGDATPGREALGGYSLRLVDVLLGVVAFATALAYAIYAVTAHTSWMALTVPFVVVGLGRYLYLVHRHDLGEEPENVLLSDRAILACVGAWAVVSAAVLAVT